MNKRLNTIISENKTRVAAFAVLGVIVLSMLNIAVYCSGYTLPKKTLSIHDDGYDFWKSIVNKHPSYRDGYLMLAQIEKKRGNIYESLKLLDKADDIDPNEGIEVSLR